MRILLINPNTSVDMTERIAAQAWRHTRPGTQIFTLTAAFGCEVIASRASFAIASHAALDAYARHAVAKPGAADGVAIDAVVLACFGDPGLEALREVASVPVIGLLESAIEAAAARQLPFAIITAGRAWVAMLEEGVQSSPHAALFRGIHAIEADGLQVGRNPASALPGLQCALDDAGGAGAGAVILGGSALAGFDDRLHSTTVLIDPLQTAIAAAQRSRPATADKRRRRPLRSSGLGEALQSLLGRN